MKKWVGSRNAACMWIFTKAVLCDGRGPTQENLRRKLSTFMASVICVCEDALRDHEWGLLWFSSPSRLNRIFTNSGEKIAKYHAAVDMAIEATFTMPSEGLHKSRTCLLRSESLFLYRSLNKDWNVKEERKGWDWENVRVCLPATMTGTTTFPMRADATESPEDVAPLILRCVLCSLI